MDALLPSEIARLVLGYLLEHCNEAAQLFLEKSPLLQECRIFKSKGKKLPLKVNQLSLIDILEKYCTTTILVEESVSTLPDSHQIKKSTDFIEQLKYLLDSSKKCTSTINDENPVIPDFGSPIVSGSSRLIYNYSHENDKCKSCSKTEDKSNKSDAQGAKSLEKTPFKNFPINKSPKNAISTEKNVNSSNDSSNKINLALSSSSSKTNEGSTSNNNGNQSFNKNENKNLVSPKIKCTAATNTEEILSFSCVEVQTIPDEIHGFESPINDEPIENLSILSKELLNRTEIHERIAEQINKALLPPETTENVTSENPNSSIYNDLNNAIKTVVEATETDPVFEKFLYDVIGVVESDSSPDEDTDNKQVEEIQDCPLEQDNYFIEAINTDKIDHNVERQASIPLKHRLRSSKSQNQTNNEDKEKIDDEKLSRINEEAIMNIVNVVASNKNLMKQHESPLKTAMNQIKQKSARKSSAKKNKNIESKQPLENVIQEPEVEQEIVPTLVVCSKEEIDSLNIREKRDNEHAGYIPIAPKLGEIIHPVSSTPETKIFLRTVNVPRPKSQPPQPQNVSQYQVPILMNVANTPSGKKVVCDVQESIIKPVTESITLYGCEANAELKLTPSSMPIINFQDQLNLTGTGLSPFFKSDNTTQNQITNKNTVDEKNDFNNFDKKQNNEIIHYESQETHFQNKAKQTPTSLMKLRNKNFNKRLSLSTPRKKISHVRALDFNTPTKSLSAKKHIRSADRTKSVCRSTLFKSPPFSENESNLNSFKSVKNIDKSIKNIDKSIKTIDKPIITHTIATRSPMPKLQGDWDKYTGVGMILEDNSSSASSAEKPNFKKSVDNSNENFKLKKSPLKKFEPKPSWDSDLRKLLNPEGSVQLNSKKIQNKRQNNSKKEVKVLNPTKNNKTARILKQKNITKLKIDIEEAINTDHENIKNDTESTIPDNTSKISESKNESLNLKENCNKKEIFNTAKEPKKISPETSKIVTSFSDFGDLETPRKEILLQFPPTPKFRTPGDSLIRTNSKMSDSKSIKDFIETPDCPPKTPKITYTPKHLDNDSEHLKKSSPYYEPSIDIIDKVHKHKETKLSQTVAEDNLTNYQNENTIEVEITKFQCIKGNLKENEISPKVNEISNDDDFNKNSSVSEINSTKETVSSDSGSESDSDSNSSTSSRSSSSSSSSDSSSSDSTPFTSPQKSIRSVNEIMKESNAQINNQVNNENITLNINNLKKELQNEKINSPNKVSTEEVKENSPKKMFPLVNDGAEFIKETPAKDENIMNEEMISETPNSSKPGVVDTLTNLSSKFSTVKSPDDNCIKKPVETLKQISKVEQIPVNNKPKILNIQRVVGPQSKPLQILEISKILRSEAQNKDTKPTAERKSLQTINSDLSKELIEKKQRISAKLHEESSKQSVYYKKSMQSEIEKNKNISSIADKKSVNALNLKKNIPENGPLNNTVKIKDIENVKNLEENEPKEPIKIIDEEKINVLKRSPRKKNLVNNQLNVKTESYNTKELVKKIENTVLQKNIQIVSNETSSSDKKGISKIKVDQIKRDLFTGDQKIEKETVKDTSSSINSSLDISNEQPTESSILESLNLVPKTPKHNENDLNRSNDFQKLNKIINYFTFDDSKPIKKRKIYSDNLKNTLAESYNIKMGGKVVSLTATNQKMIFAMSPKINKTNKLKVNTRKKTKSENKNVKLATSSPIKKTESKYLEEKNDQVKTKRKTNKRILSPQKDDKPVIKKFKTAPQDLLNRIKIDDFLTSVHDKK